MSKFIVFSFICSLCLSCAHRGYNSLSQEVPEFFPEFKAENYERKETPKNIVYVEKSLPQSQKDKEEFYEEEYRVEKKPNSYQYYVPKDRVPASMGVNEFFVSWPKIKTSIASEEEALLIE